MLARSRQGRRGPNLVVACERCNGAKADGDYEQFVRFANIVLRSKFPRSSTGEAMKLFWVWQAATLFGVDP